MIIINDKLIDFVKQEQSAGVAVETYAGYC